MSGAPAPAEALGARPGVPLTAAVIAPVWALAYGAGVLALNVALQVGARSEPVIAVLRAIVLSAAPWAGTSRALALAVLSALIVVSSYALMLLPAIVMAFTARSRGVSLAGAIGLRGVRLGQTLRLAATVVLGGFVAVAAYASFARSLGFPVEGNTADLVAGFGAGPVEMVLAFVLVGVVAPFVEEVTFRGIVFPSLRAAWGTLPALLVSGVIFGVVHLQLTIAAPLAVIGIALALVFMRTRSLWTAIVAHCAYNIAMLALAFLFAR